MFSDGIDINFLLVETFTIILKGSENIIFIIWI